MFQRIDPEGESQEVERYADIWETFKLLISDSDDLSPDSMVSPGGMNSDSAGRLIESHTIL